MRTLHTDNTVIAVMLILGGIFLIFAIGVTGLIFAVAGVVLAAITCTFSSPSRFGVLLLVTADLIIGFLAGGELIAAVSGAGSSFAASTREILAPALVLSATGFALIAAALDWRKVAQCPWF
jgi:hypothetical protein